MATAIRRSIRANFSFTLTGSLIYSACQWAMVALVTKYSEGDLSNLVIALSVSAPVIVFFNLQLRLLQALDASNKYRFGDLLSLRLIAQCLSLLVLGSWAYLYANNSALATCVILISLSRAFYSIGETFYGEQQKAERMGGIASSMSVKGVLSILAFSYFLIMRGDLTSALLAWTSVHFLMLVFDARQTILLGMGVKQLLPTANFKAMSALVKKGMPLGISGLLISLQINIPNYALMTSEYKDEVGVFGAILFLTTIGRKIIESGVRATGPRLANVLAEGRLARFQQLRLKLTVLSGGLGVLGLAVAFVFGEQLLSILYTDAFMPYAGILLWVIIGETFNFSALALEHALSAGRKIDAQLKSITSSVVVLLAASWWLIPTHGVAGAAWAVALGGFARLTTSLLLTKHFDVRQ
ncbi:MAG TPA: hypothetical protein EYN86_05550 [Planctomycetes bacterium]|nr:hypothetical protein [Planctomycetota bacterium]